MLRICKECGKQFETSSSRRQFCYEDHFRVCKYCSKPYLVPSNKLHSETSYCSEACRRAMLSELMSARPQYVCKCKLCGKEFLSCNKTATLCSDLHPVICEACGREFMATPGQVRAGKKTCSESCRYALAHQKFMDNIDKNMQAFRVSMLNKYGVDNPMKLLEIQKKAQATNCTRYGAAHFGQTDEFRKRCIATNQERYGVDWHMQTDEHKQSARSTCMSKYGVDNPGKVGAYIVDKMTDPSKLSNLMKFKEDPIQFIHDNFDTAPTLAQLGDLCGIRDSSVGQLVDKLNLRSSVKYTYSVMEDEVYQFMTTLLDASKIIRNTFKVITPYELDLYVPEFQFAIECNPTITHNSSIPGFSKDDPPKPVSYHKMKSDMCRTRGIFLFHIFGYDWTHHKSVCQSMIASILGHTSSRYFARNLSVRNIDFITCSNFLDINHRQGKVNSKVRLGLYTADEELVAVMTFSKMRNTIGTGKDTCSTYWELSRFCSKLNTSVVGGASKLFKYFCRTYHPEVIRSFSDNAHTRGNLYSTLGFNEVRRSDPGYVWVNLKSDRAFSRNNAQKKNIRKFLNDPNIDLSKTEREIMIEHGFVQVYDSGTTTWEWRGNNNGY